MEIDPEVQALLDDGTAPTLPHELVKEGWGRFSIADLHEDPRRPATKQQPDFDENCARCGRPITMVHGYWKDHVGRKRCDGALLLDGPAWDYHVNEDEWNYLVEQAKRRIDYPIAVRKAKPATACEATRSSRNVGAHQHKCEHPSGHFGMHECSDPTCHHLWH